MASLNKLYGRGNVFADGQLLGEATSISITFNANVTPQNTLAHNYSGVFLGPKSTEITVESLIPDEGVEFDPTDYIINNRPVSLVVFIANKMVTVAGYFGSADLSTSVDNAATLNFSFAGGEAFLQSA